MFQIFYLYLSNNLEFIFLTIWNQRIIFCRVANLENVAISHLLNMPLYHILNSYIFLYLI